MIVKRGLVALAVGIGLTAAAGVATAASAGHAAKACETSSHQLRLLKNGHCPAGSHQVTLGAQGKNVDLFKDATPSSSPGTHPVAVLRMSRLVPGVYQVSGNVFFTMAGHSSSDAADLSCTTTRSGLSFDATPSGRVGTVNTVARDSEITVVRGSAAADVLKCAVAISPQVTDVFVHDVVITAVRMANETSGP
jgi:hypothetical protein